MPQELPSVLSLVYSNIPPIKKGTDSRFGFGFRLGEHADYQVLIELGPQKYTRPLGNFTLFSLSLLQIVLTFHLYCVFSSEWELFASVNFIGKGADSSDDASIPDTSKRMVEQTDYNKKLKVKKRKL